MKGKINMNVRLPGLNKRSNRKVQPDLEFIKNSIKEELSTVRQEERETTTRRLIKLMCYVLHEKYGFGQQRCATVAMGIAELINEGLDFWEGDVGDFWYKIDEGLKFMGEGDNFYPTEDEIAKEKLMKEG